MPMRKLLFVLYFFLAALPMPALAADCSNGRGELQKPLWEGYNLQIGPAQGDHVNECFAAVVGPDGKTVFSVFGSDATMLRVTGRDVNGDGKPDVVLLTHGTASPENVYSIVGTAEPAGLIRQIVTSAELSFEERSEGHTEIVTRDIAFRDLEGLAADQVPYPMLFLRLKGKEIYNVSQIYWPEYERAISLARGRLSKKDMEILKTDEFAQMGHDKEKEMTPEVIAHIQEVKSVVLEIVLDYIYGGRGEEGWKALTEFWAYSDRQRIRQELLRRRMSGVLRDINRPLVPPAQRSSN